MAVGGSGDAMAGLIGGVYEAALDASRWPEVLARFCVAFDSDAALIFGHDFTSQTVEVTGGPTQLAAHHGFSDEAIRDFGLHYCDRNVWMADERLHVEGTVVSSARLFPERQLLQTEWGDWMHRQGLFHSFAAVVEKRAERSFNLSGLRARRRGPYSSDEQRRLAGLMPHLQTAFALHRRLHRAQALAQASLAVLDGLPIGVVLLGEGARLLHCNPRALALMEQTGLLSLGVDERLHTVHAKDMLLLQNAIRMAVSTGQGAPLCAGQVLRLHGFDGVQLHILVAPLPQQSEPFGTAAAAAVFISDPQAQTLSLVRSLQHLYRMTAAEARLAQALVNGASFQEYAEAQQLSVHTVRNQYKSAAAKLGVGRQADFVRVVLMGPAVLQWSSAPRALAR